MDRAGPVGLKRQLAVDSFAFVTALADAPSTESLVKRLKQTILSSMARDVLQHINDCSRHTKKVPQLGVLRGVGLQMTKTQESC